MTGLLLALALHVGAADVAAAPSAGTAAPASPSTLTDTAGTGSQAIVVAVSGVPAGTTLVVERPGVGAVALRDPGSGYVQGTFHGEPARFANLRVYAQDAGGARRDLFDGMVVLSDARRDTIAYTFDRDGKLARLPIAPSLFPTPLAADPNGPWRVSLGWAALAFAYVGLLGVTWAVRRR